MIDEKSAEIRAIVKGEAEGNLLVLNKELEKLMDERAAVLRDSIKQDDQLKAFYDQETALKNKIDNWKQTILAEEDGVVSFHFDGTEILLTPENMTKLTVKNINDILQGKSSYTSTEATASRALYRPVSYTHLDVYKRQSAMRERGASTFRRDSRISIRPRRCWTPWPKWRGAESSTSIPSPLVRKICAAASQKNTRRYSAMRSIPKQRSS